MDPEAAAAEARALELAAARRAEDSFERCDDLLTTDDELITKSREMIRLARLRLTHKGYVLKTWGGGRRKHLVGAAADGCVAFAGEPFEAGAIDEVNVTATVADQTGRLEQPRGDRHCGSPHAEHLAEKLLGQGEGVAVDAIVRLQQPAA